MCPGVSQFYKPQLAFPLTASSALPTACQERHLASALECYLLPAISSMEGWGGAGVGVGDRGQAFPQDKSDISRLSLELPKTFLGNCLK